MEEGEKEVEITAWSVLGKDTEGTRSREEIQGVLALCAGYSWNISKQQILCFIPTDETNSLNVTDSLNVSVFAPARCYL